jgi:hypothetical protein
MLAERSDQPGSKSQLTPVQNRLRVAVIDRDTGFVQVLVKRL